MNAAPLLPWVIVCKEGETLATMWWCNLPSVHVHICTTTTKYRLGEACFGTAVILSCGERKETCVLHRQKCTQLPAAPHVSLWFCVRYSIINFLCDAAPVHEISFQPTARREMENYLCVFPPTLKHCITITI